MTNPRVSETRNRAVIAVRRDRTGFGEKRTWSMTSRTGSSTLVIGIEILPLASRI
jgi:hypothetical protein